MKANNKQLKTKTVAIRMQEEIYNFIAKKSAEQGLTKSDYLISQFDMKSELMIYISEQDGLLQLELQRLKKELNDSRKDWEKHWKEASDEEVTLALKKAKVNPKDVVNKPIISEAKRRNLYIS